MDGLAAHDPAGHHGRAEVAWPTDAQFGRATAGKIAMWIFLVSDGFSFAGLLLAYGILRGGSAEWRHAGEPELAVPFAAGLTFLLICSSTTMMFAWEAARRKERNRAAAFLALTALGGVLFLLGQYSEYFGIRHPGLVQEGLVFGASAYANSFYAVTGFHGLHVLAGTLYLLIMLARTLQGRATASQVELLALFWHFVDGVWSVVFTLVYLVPKVSP